MKTRRVRLLVLVLWLLCLIAVPQVRTDDAQWFDGREGKGGAVRGRKSNPGSFRPPKISRKLKSPSFHPVYYYVVTKLLKTIHIFCRDR
jgi:hypothetical protein